MTALIFVLGCGLFTPGSSPTPDLLATLQASTPSSFSSPVATDVFATPALDVPSPNPSSVGGQTSIPSPSASDGLTGHIVFTCQLFKVQAMDQVCMMSADGSGMRRLTTEDNLRHFYPSLAPDGQSVLYAGFREQNVYEIYTLNLSDNKIDRLTNRMGVLNAPEVSPDGTSIVFTKGNPNNGQFQIVVMDRNGENASNIPQVVGWDLLLAREEVCGATSKNWPDLGAPLQNRTVDLLLTMGNQQRAVNAAQPLTWPSASSNDL